MKRNRLLLMLCLCGILGLTGCRSKVAETESETETETVAKETETEKASETETEKETQKSTTSSDRTTVKPSTVNGNSSKRTSSNNRTSSNSNSSTTATQQCPYCYQQISTASNGAGSTIYADHVAQEKAWADTYGYGDTSSNQDQADASNNTTQADAPDTSDLAQCGYCYQWFTVSDGTYNAHLQAENASLGMPEGTEYITCPVCGYSYPKGNLYDNHVHVTN